MEKINAGMREGLLIFLSSSIAHTQVIIKSLFYDEIKYACFLTECMKIKNNKNIFLRITCD